MCVNLKSSVSSVICLLLSAFNVNIVSGIFFNPCNDVLLICQCGSTSIYPVHVNLKQFLNFNFWPPRCLPLESTSYSMNLLAFDKPLGPDLSTAGILCSPFRYCQECKDTVLGCISCPSGMYGSWCQNKCGCQNDGFCNQMNGKCTCPKGYVGEFCESREVSYCNTLETIANLHWINGSSNNVGDVATAWCDPGYVLIGNKTRTCTPQGTWTGRPPFCDAICELPRLGPHLQTNLNPGMPLDADKTEVIKEISFKCDEGYSLVGPHRILCQNTGTWDQMPPKCKPKINCHDPGTPSNCTRLVFDAIDGAFAPGTQIRFSCKSGFFLDGAEAIFCTATGKWSADTPSCLPVTGCPVPDAPKNGNLEITKTITPIAVQIAKKIVSRMGIPTGFNMPSRQTELSPNHVSINSRALYTCQSIYYQLKGSASRVCLPNGQWGGTEPTCEAICGRASESKRPFIINGTASELGKWPWQAFIGFRNSTTGKWKKTCGGSLISELFVITAAHCVAQKSSSQIHPIENFKVYLGKHFRFDDLDDPEVRVIMVESIIVHPNYHPRSLDSDIAMVKLKIPVHFSKRIQPVCLPRSTITCKKELPEGQVGVVTGWGYTEDGLQADILQEASIPIVRKQKCEEGYRSVNISVVVTSNMFCAGLQQGGIGTCKGDSGGPFVIKKEMEDFRGYILEGLISWGSTRSCAMANHYSGFLKVVNYVDWINHFL